MYTWSINISYPSYPHLSRFPAPVCTTLVDVLTTFLMLRTGTGRMTSLPSSDKFLDTCGYCTAKDGPQEFGRKMAKKCEKGMNNYEIIQLLGGIPTPLKNMSHLG